MTTTVNNEHKNIKVPNLRFPEFQGEWEVESIKDVADFMGGGTPSSSNESFWQGTIPWVSSSDIVENDIKNISISRYITEEAIAHSATKLCPAPSILIVSRVGVGKIALSKKAICTSQDFCNLINIKVDPIFLTYCLSQIMKRKSMEVQGTSIKGITTSEIQKISINIPSLQEQKKIGKILSLLDERIATQNKIIEDLKMLKSAISHILFSSKGAILLSEIANVVMGQSPSSNAYNDQGLGMPLVQGNLDISNGKTTPRLYTAEFNQTTEKGNIILTVRAPVGEVAKATQKVCLGRGVCAIIPHEENMSDFIYQYLTFYKFMWRRYEQGSTFTSINGSDVRNILCPKVRNVSILTLLDRKINIEERVVKQYQSQKQYMLYQMFI